MRDSAKKIKIFCDFDGTVTIGDVGDFFFSTFTRQQSLDAVELWEAGKIDSREMYLRTVDLLQLTPQEYENFLDQQQLDPYFPMFVQQCQQFNIPVTILSDGLDFYINPLLARHGLAHLQVYANEMHWNGHGKFEIKFPFYDHTCGYCANCKGYQLRRLRQPDDMMVFIGDGLSDLCGVKEADLVLAKDVLASYCDQKKITYIPYQNFADLLTWLKDNYWHS